MVPEKLDKVSKDFYELCYKQYEFEIKETDQIYQRVSFALSWVTVQSLALYAFGRDQGSQSAEHELPRGRDG